MISLWFTKKINYYSLIPQLFHKHPNHSSYYTLINTIITHIINSTLINKYKYKSISFLVKRERNPKMVQIDLLFIHFSFFFLLFKPLKISKKIHPFEPHSVSYFFKDYFIIFYFYIFVLILKYSSICDFAFLLYFFFINIRNHNTYISTSLSSIKVSNTAYLSLYQLYSCKKSNKLKWSPRLIKLSSIWIII